MLDLRRIKCDRFRADYNPRMSIKPSTTQIEVPPKRSVWSILMLLALVLAITAQLVTGFTMMASFNGTLLVAHVSVGVIAVLLTITEWAWLLGTPAGTYRLRKFFAAGSTPAEWSEAGFLIIASITVMVGAILASILYLGVNLPFAALLLIHQGLATAVAIVYIIHVILAARRTARRRAIKSEIAD